MPSGIKLTGVPLKDFEVAMIDIQTRITDTKTHILLAKPEEINAETITP
jgi:hypothetical protein